MSVGSFQLLTLRNVIGNAIGIFKLMVLFHRFSSTYYFRLLYTRVYLVVVGYFLSLDKLLNNSAMSSRMITPLNTGNNTYHHPKDLICSEPVTAIKAVAPPGG